MYIDGIKTVLSDSKEISVIGEASDGNQLIELIPTNKPDLILLDINMPGMDGLESAKIIKSQYGDIKIIMLTQYNNKRFVKRCQLLGVEGYLLKDCGKPELINAIHTVYNGGFYYNINSRNKTILQPPGLTTDKPKLSGREIEVLSLLANDKSIFEIAAKLKISEASVKTYRNRLKIKSGTNSIAGLISWAYQNSIIPLLL